MRTLTIIFCLLIAVSHMLNIALVIYLHHNGRRLSGVIISALKVVVFFVTALSLKTDLIGSLDTLIIVCFAVMAAGAVRRSWLLLQLYAEKNDDQMTHMVN